MLERAILIGNIIVLLLLGMKIVQSEDFQETVHVKDTTVELARKIKSSRIYTEELIITELFYESLELKYMPEENAYYFPEKYENVIWDEEHFHTDEDGTHVLFMETEATDGKRISFCAYNWSHYGIYYLILDD